MTPLSMFLNGAAFGGVLSAVGCWLIALVRSGLRANPPRERAAECDGDAAVNLQEAV
ncbi:hypothetical protein [Nocardia thailandica]|uniref:hypothetical protein n=1 Tax=Nocardia thailandica TaxID=257275 RepID=UPI0002E8F06A|nr:hypothetical protein [Nocardia thailandica]